MFLRATPFFISSTLVLSAILSFSWMTARAVDRLPVQTEEALPHVALKSGADLATDAKEARNKQVPVLLFFSMEHCPFCNEVEEDYLKPMLRNSDYDGKVVIRKIKIDDNNFVKDFNGQQREPDEFSDEYNVSMVPTLVLVNAQGKKLGPAIRGIRNSHYYSAELDDAIDASIVKIRALAKR
ncbi:MAG: thioredoxin fold domain-containing protein [Gammaproteobacteria bacterium]|nr:thioredoxin fold domain-containing protein [Gammaproteobacteria bacterium]MCW8987288.1 thioredoxin fold domain-containing protein [Gammaproteobacteria bacterium]MCW9031011.1 thioredoxin fold domain-containing protein [Gammaproteobacteria bacterium]